MEWAALLKGFKKQFKQKFFWDVFKTFLGVFLAYSLGQWSAEKSLARSEHTILKAVRDELVLDLADLRLNMTGHEQGLAACREFMKLLYGKKQTSDSLFYHYNNLLRQFVTIQHNTAYESLKARGLEIVKDDSLRTRIVNLYDFHFEVIQKIEEDYEPHKFLPLYREGIEKCMVEHIKIPAFGRWEIVKPFAQMPENDRKQFSMWLQTMFMDRTFLLSEYKKVEAEMVQLQQHLDTYLK